jgi:superfamily II DNA helicase RecQ
VIHFDVPHGLDAYYQEIGRAARDGWTGHAFLLYTPGSMGVAARKERAVLTVEKATNRAKAMLRGRFDLKHEAKGSCLVPLHAVPKHVEKDSELNHEWNVATLNLLEQVGDVDVKWDVLRRVHVRRRKGVRSGHRVGAEEVVTRALQGHRSGELDLARVAGRWRLEFERLEADMVMLALLGRVELDNLDRARGEAWVLIRRKTRRVWSEEHVKRLKRRRAEQLDAANRGLEELRRFVHSRECRLYSLARLYGLRPGHRCGHCDRCSARLDGGKVIAGLRLGMGSSRRDGNSESRSD